VTYALDQPKAGVFQEKCNSNRPYEKRNSFFILTNWRSVSTKLNNAKGSFRAICDVVEVAYLLAILGYEEKIYPGN
jgi:hypothetical protein